MKGFTGITVIVAALLVSAQAMACSICVGPPQMRRHFPLRRPLAVRHSLGIRRAPLPIGLAIMPDQIKGK